MKFLRIALELLNWKINWLQMRVEQGVTLTFHKYQPNETGRDFVSGDIHGCFSDLEVEMRRVNFDTGLDRMFCVGDLTDRGPESSRAIHFLETDWFFPVLGNHEDIILQCYRDKESPTYWHNQNGGKWIQNQSAEWIERYISLIENLPLVIQVGSYGIVHSSVPKGISWDNFVQKAGVYRELILWRRYRTYNETIEGIKTVYAGHTINRRYCQLLWMGKKQNPPYFLRRFLDEHSIFAE
ncbi:MAG: serine/threonine protein phosphatase [Spirochaetes bacterium]|nr:MAG: serine/threonine protein phosphatase [Spirochaetota bacterium]